MLAHPATSVRGIHRSVPHDPLATPPIPLDAHPETVSYSIDVSAAAQRLLSQHQSLVILLALEILDAENHLVRRYASTDKPEPLEKIAAANPIPMYWVRPQQILSAASGMHRFVWDVHYPPPDALNHEFPISAIFWPLLTF